MTRRMSKQHLALAIEFEAFDPHTNPIAIKSWRSLQCLAEAHPLPPPLLPLAAAALTHAFVHLTILLVRGVLSSPLQQDLYLSVEQPNQLWPYMTN